MPGFRPAGSSFSSPVAHQPVAAPSARKSPQIFVFDRNHVLLGGAFVIVAIVAVALLLHVFARPSEPTPSPADGVAVGTALASEVIESLAKGFEADAEELEAGKSAAQANEELKKVFDKGRKTAFERIGGPYLSKIVPSGEEPGDKATRKAFAQAHREIAKGLREGR